MATWEHFDARVQGWLWWLGLVVFFFGSDMGLPGNVAAGVGLALALQYWLKRPRRDPRLALPAGGFEVVPAGSESVFGVREAGAARLMATAIAAPMAIAAP